MLSEGVDAEKRPLRGFAFSTRLGGNAYTGSVELEGESVREEERYRNLVEQASDGIFLTDAEGVYREVNESGARMLGMTRAEIIGKRVVDVIVEEELPRFAREYSRVLAGEILLGEWRMRRKDGTIFPGEVSAKRLSDGWVQGILRDVTDRKVAERSIEASAARARDLAAVAFDGIAVTEGGRVLELNDRFCEMFGYERSELIGQEVMCLVAPESRELVLNAIRTERQEAYEHIAVRKDGSRLIVEVRGAVTLVGGRRARVTVIRDVTRRRRLEEAIRQIVEGTNAVGNEFFRGLVQGVASALGVRYAFVAELLPGSVRRARTLAAWGNGRAIPDIEYDLAGTPCEDVVERGLCYFPTEVQELFPSDVLLREMGAVSYLGLPLFGTAGSPIGLLVAIHDQSIEHSELAASILTIFAGRAAAEMERLRVDAALRHSEASLRATIDTTPNVAVQWFDADGRVLLWNRASEQLFGWTTEEALGKTLDELIHTKEEERAFRDLLLEIERTGRPHGPVEVRFRHRDGSEGYCLSTTFRIQGVDGRRRFVCMDVDVTERKRAERRKEELEEQLRHTQKLEALGTLAGGIAHDFNNILAAIFAYTELAHLDVHDPKETVEHLMELKKAAGRARDLVQQILTFSRRQGQERTPIQLEPVVQEALRFLRSTLPSTIEMDTRVEQDLPRVLGTSIQIHQVILNLCMNAAHAMRTASGRLTVTLDVMTFTPGSMPTSSELRAGRYIRLVVSDTGHGMPPEIQSRIFDPFFTTKPQGEGTGLGLAVVHGIIRDHDGAVRVSSQPGQGTSFEVFLPTLEWAQADARTSIAPCAPGRGERVLFVDDEPGLCLAWQSLLERLGYRVTTHTDPFAALTELGRHDRKFDVVITDLTMPRMTGTELARRMLELQPKLPILLASGFSGGLGRDEARALGLADLLVKPLTPDSLAVALRHAIEGTA